MSTVVLSPHTDDAVFSLGAYMAGALMVPIVIAPMAGIPTDVSGKEKHTKLRAEHAEAMQIVKAVAINGPFLDDVYPCADRDIIRQWIKLQLEDASEVYIPLGIHHPDHLLVSNIALGLLLGEDVTVRFYEELPYRKLYPGMVRERTGLITSLFGPLKAVDTSSSDVDAKDKAVRAYESQTSEALIETLMTPERIWEPVR